MYQFGKSGLKVEICTVFAYLFRYLFFLGEKLSILILITMKPFGA